MGEENKPHTCDWLQLHGIPCSRNAAQGRGPIPGCQGNEIWLCQGHLDQELAKQQSLTPALSGRAVIDAMWNRLAAARLF